MTNKEAVQEIEGIFENVYGLSERERDALDMAIDALQENESLARTVNEASELLRKKRPYGEWKVDNKIYCSECGESICDFIPNPTDAIGIILSNNFCPNCGSDNRPRILDEAIDGEGKDGNVKEGE